MLAIETALQEEKEATKKFMADNNIMELQEIRKMQVGVEGCGGVWGCED